MKWLGPGMHVPEGLEIVPKKGADSTDSAQRIMPVGGGGGGGGHIRRIDTVLFEQHLVTTPLDDGSFLQYDDFVRMDDRRQSVRNDNRCPVGAHFCQSRLDVPLRLGVQCTGGFVEEHDRGPLQNRSGNCHSLLFASTQPQPSFAHLRFVLVREREDSLVNVGTPGRHNDVGFRCTNSTVLNVVLDGIVEQHGILGYHADCLA
uniref:Uncharacterized protein n=1 Tax=Anopheles atroparvus TaxID=41427 RepID=A0A182JBT3_ANOAO